MAEVIHRRRPGPWDGYCILDPSILLSAANWLFLHGAHDERRIVVPPTLANMVLLPSERWGPKYADLFGQLLTTWQLREETIWDSISLIRGQANTLGVLREARRRSRRALSELEREEPALSGALKAATRAQLPRPWTVEDILYQEIALAYHIRSPAICQSTSPPAFFKTLKSLGAKAVDELGDEAAEVREAGKKLGDRWDRWKDAHPSLLKAMRTYKDIIGLPVDLVFVALYGQQAVVPILAERLFSSFLTATLDPP